MLIVLTVAVLFVMLLALIRAMRGPTIYDRILAVNVFGTKTVLLITIEGFVFDRPDFLDIALAYALINFISVIGVLRYFEYTRASREREPS